MKVMGHGQLGHIEANCERPRILADGSSYTIVTFAFDEDQAEGSQLSLKLLKNGSFSPEGSLHEISVPISERKAEVKVYAPKVPGMGVLQADGVRLKIEFAPVSVGQSLLHEWTPTLGIALVIALLLRSFVVASYYIPSGSMEGTLLKNDLLIADKLTYKIMHEGPRRGDVMIFQYPENRKQDYIKRTIGLPGDVVEVREGIVYVNKVPLKEPYIKEMPLQDYGPVTVPKDSYFMMGDNRNHSSDSRVWGFVPKSYFEGRALFVFFPFPRAKFITNDLLAQDQSIPPGSAMAAEPDDSKPAAAAADSGK